MLGCQGLWFDMLEKEDLVSIEGSEAINIGNEQVGEEYNTLQNINAPECTVTMPADRRQGPGTHQIRILSNLLRDFFDAGEFRDLKERTVLERFTQMLGTLRTNL